MKKRFLSLLLTTCLVVGLMPTAVFAAGTDTGKAIQLVDSGTAANIEGGQADNLYFGAYQQSSAGSTEPDGTEGVDWIKSDTATQKEQGPYYYIDPVKWRVLSNADGQLFLLSDQNLDVFPYHTDCESVTWEKSTMRSWLNGYGASENTGGDSGTDYTSDNFIDNAFSEKEQAAIADTEVVNDDNPTYSTEGGNNTTDKIFLLSIAEANDSSYFADNSSRISTNTAYVAGGGKTGSDYMFGVGNDYWWLRSPGNYGDYAASVADYGGVDSYGNGSVGDGSTAVRPAFNLDLNSVLFTSAAAGGKEGDGELNAVTDYDGNEWKLTLLDSSREFAVTETEVSGISGGTVTLHYTGAATGDNEYISVILADASGVQYYGRVAQPTEADGTAEVTIPAGLAAGTYTLYAFSEQYNGDYMTDYASALQEISLNVLPKEATPQAVFTAADDNSGTLSNVDASMKYSTDGGASWTDITGATATVTGVTADKDIQVVKKGGGTATADSDVQIIDVTQAAIPAGLGKTDCTTAAQNDGTITGVDSTMEYRLSAASEWTSISGNTVTGLANGTYEVRVKANGTVLASAAATVTIGAHTCVAQGGWQHDENGHWKLCVCGAEVDRAAHTGGTATCTEKAVCDVCGAAYGEVNAANHTSLVKTDAKAPTCTEDGNIEYWYCNDCQKYFSDENATEEIALAETVVPAAGHGETELKNQKDATCTEAGYTGDKVCAVCGEILEKGETVAKLAHNYKDGKCTVCGAADPDYKPADAEIPKTGGEADSLAVLLAALFVSGGLLTAAGALRRKTRAK